MALVIYEYLENNNRKRYKIKEEQNVIVRPKRETCTNLNDQYNGIVGIVNNKQSINKKRKE